MPVLRIDHLGIAVDSHESARDVYEDLLGLEAHHVEEVASQRVRTAFYPCDTVNLELLEPTDPEGPVGRFLEKRGEGFHHVAFEVADIEAELKRLKRAGVRLVDEAPRPGAHGTKIAFLHPKAARGMLIELVERPKD
jgi:methylmalonyl-CoA/ethylmalonyl-CoA epimerase